MVLVSPGIMHMGASVCDQVWKAVQLSQFWISSAVSCNFAQQLQLPLAA